MKLCSGKRRRPRSWRAGSKLCPRVRLAGLRSARTVPVGVPRSGCISGALYATSRWEWTKGRGLVGGSASFVLPARGLWLCSRRAEGSGLVQRVPLTGTARRSPSRVGRRRLRPVLKHGPRSLTRAQVGWFSKPSGVVKAKADIAQLRDDPALVAGAIPALRIDLVSCGAARAHALGPERW